MNGFVSHPSVRIKGTENNYEPAECALFTCSKRLQYPHMHCPFCVKTDSYQDPVILKAHFRVKHVDKGIDFAGLKILRCCDHCDIVGSIKGAKQFKGAHWHCYRCRNGFNRRDEALKHFKTHFRNPQTTFQIQVSQDVSDMFKETGIIIETEENGCVSTIEIENPDSVITTLSPSAILSEDSGQTEMTAFVNKRGGNEGQIQQVSVAANETVGTTDGQTIMVIQDVVTSTDLSDQSHVIDVANVKEYMNEVEQGQDELRKTIRNLNLLLQEKMEVEEQLKAEIEEYKMCLTRKEEEISGYQKREDNYIQQLSIPLDNKTNNLLVELKEQHESLLCHQLAQLKQTYLQALPHTLSQHVKDEHIPEQQSMPMGMEISEVDTTSKSDVMAASCDVITMTYPTSEEIVDTANSSQDDGDSELENTEDCANNGVHIDNEVLEHENRVVISDNDVNLLECTDSGATFIIEKGLISLTESNLVNINLKRESGDSFNQTNKRKKHE